MSAKINPFTVRSGSGANCNNYRIPTLPKINPRVKIAVDIAADIAALMTIAALFVWAMHAL